MKKLQKATSDKLKRRAERAWAEQEEGTDNPTPVMHKLRKSTVHPHRAWFENRGSASRNEPRFVLVIKDGRGRLSCRATASVPEDSDL